MNDADDGLKKRQREAIDGLRRNPNGWRIKQLEAICAICGATCAPPRGGGSHYKVSKPGKREILTIPYKRPIKPIYIRKLIAFLSEDDHG